MYCGYPCSYIYILHTHMCVYIYIHTYVSYKYSHSGVDVIWFIWNTKKNLRIRWKIQKVPGVATDPMLRVTLLRSPRPRFWIRTGRSTRTPRTAGLVERCPHFIRDLVAVSKLLIKIRFVLWTWLIWRLDCDEWRMKTWWTTIYVDWSRDPDGNCRSFATSWHHVRRAPGAFVSSRARGLNLGWIGVSCGRFVQGCGLLFLPRCAESQVTRLRFRGRVVALEPGGAEVKLGPEGMTGWPDDHSLRVKTLKTRVLLGPCLASPCALRHCGGGGGCSGATVELAMAYTMQFGLASDPWQLKGQDGCGLSLGTPNSPRCHVCFSV